MSDCQRWEPLDDSTMRQSVDGGWVLIGDYSFLKREAHILRLTCQDLQSQNASLKAEVERLTAFTTRTIIPNEELQAQVERLTKAGDEVIREWSMGDETDALNFMKALVIWNAAKEGKDREAQP